MKKTLRYFVPLIFGWVLATGMAVAADPQPTLLPAPQPAVAAAAVSELLLMTPAAKPAAEIDLFTPKPQPAAICPEIGCVNDQYCRRDRDCTAAPGGVCNLFCPTRGCCAYP